MALTNEIILSLGLADDIVLGISTNPKIPKLAFLQNIGTGDAFPDVSAWSYKFSSTLVLISIDDLCWLVENRLHGLSTACSINFPVFLVYNLTLFIKNVVILLNQSHHTDLLSECSLDSAQQPLLYILDVQFLLQLFSYPELLQSQGKTSLRIW